VSSHDDVHEEARHDWLDNREPEDVPTAQEVEDDQPTSGFCEDFPCCGHEANDCFGQKYGSDEEIKRRAIEEMDEGWFGDHVEPEGFR